MITVQNVHKIEDGRTVLEIGALEVATGTIAAVTGASKSGKEALFALLTGRSRPTGGAVSVAGCDPVTDRQLFSRRVGVLFAEDTLYSTRSPRANLMFQARLRGLPRSRVDEVLALVGLADHSDSSYEGLSSGLRRRLAMGLAILHAPSVLLLSEPFSRCDSASIALLTRLIVEYAAHGGTVMIVADAVAHLRPLCEAIYEMDQGRIVAHRHPGEEAADTQLPFKIPVKLEGRVVLVNPSDILYALVEDGTTYLETVDERLPTQFTLTEIEARLVRSGFFRAHRAYLVNLQHVSEVIPFTRSSYSLRLDDEGGSLIPLSREAARELKELLGY